MKICKIVWVAALLALACTREKSEPAPIEGMAQYAIQASAGDVVKSVIDPGDASMKKVIWSSGEEVTVFVDNGLGYLFTSNKNTSASETTFYGYAPAGLTSGMSFFMLSPHDPSATLVGLSTVNTTLPATQTGYAGSFKDGTAILAGTDTFGNSVTCKHVCSGLRFKTGMAGVKTVTLQGNNNEGIAGDFSFDFSGSNPVAGVGTEKTVTLTAPGGGTFEADKWYYIVILPTTFSNGFILRADAGDQVGELRFDSEVVFARGKFKDITVSNTKYLNERMTWSGVKSQVYYGPQNSFCLRPGQTITFDILPRKIYGNWQRSGYLDSSGAFVPDDGDATVLWGDSSISSAVVSGNNITITASATPGSSLVAVKKGSTILWSYLIWVTESAPAETILPGGAVVLPPLGGNLYFQWGRKDPLLSTATRVENAVGKGLSYAIAHPEEFIKGANTANDWFCQNTGDQDETLWGDGGLKTVWDPCPAGYRVPSETNYTHANLDFDYLQANFAELGYISSSIFYGTSRTYWTRSVSGRYAASLDDTDDPNVLINQTRDIAAPIRCIKE